jgi:3-isopropylmalate/(R)-2-methylmalate dehydratase small subunit
MSTFRKLTSRLVPLVVDDVDTDQIIPARYLKVTEKTGLSAGLFADWRRQPDFVLDRPESKGAQILLAGNNFGCGSSREHAPWALTDFGFRAVVARSFADIFRNNALKNGLLPVEVDETVHRFIKEARALDANLELTVDLESTSLILPDGEAVKFPIDPFARRCLLDGLDELAYLQTFAAKVAAYEEQHG